MVEKIFKRLPDGEQNFASIRAENYAYVDKTRYIEMLEKENNKRQFFIRPRKFGGSLSGVVRRTVHWRQPDAAQKQLCHYEVRFFGDRYRHSRKFHQVV